MAGTPLKVLAFAASLRKESLNQRLLGIAVELLRAENVTVDLAHFREFTMPLYDGDVEMQSGLPEGAKEFKRRLENCDALLLASPEYNFSVPGTLKNAIDWVSRFKPVPLRGKTALLLSASPSLVGGSRGLWHLRVPLEGLGVRVGPDMFSLAQAHEALVPSNDKFTFKDTQLRDRLEKMLHAFVQDAQALSQERSPLKS